MVGRRSPRGLGIKQIKSIEIAIQQTRVGTSQVIQATLRLEIISRVGAGPGWSLHILENIEAQLCLGRKWKYQKHTKSDQPRATNENGLWCFRNHIFTFSWFKTSFYIDNRHLY